MENKKDIQLENCSIDLRGEMTCSIPKSKFDTMVEMGVKPKKVVFEING